MKYLHFQELLQNPIAGTSLAVQWLRLCAPTAGGAGLIPGWCKIPHAAQCGQKKDLKNPIATGEADGGETAQIGHE